MQLEPDCSRWLALLVVGIGFMACGGSEDEVPQDETPETEEEPIANLSPLPASTTLTCPDGTFLTWDNFGASFFLNHCTTCHSNLAKGQARGGAPEEANFDTLADVQIWRARIILQTAPAKPKMPPSESVPSQARSALKEWLGCGAPR